MAIIFNRNHKNSSDLALFIWYVQQIPFFEAWKLQKAKKSAKKFYDDILSLKPGVNNDNNMGFCFLDVYKNQLESFLLLKYI